MAQFIPLVRAGAVLPLVRWATEAGRPVASLLRAVDLACVADGRAERPVPLLSAVRFFRLMGEREGPDIAARSVSARSILDLGPLGTALLSAATPGKALDRVARLLPRHSTHEHVTVQASGSALRLTLGWSLRLDDVDLHLTQQFAAALVREICLAAARGAVPFTRVAIRPHPAFGLAHLAPCFGPTLTAATQPVLEIDIPVAVLNRRFPQTLPQQAVEQPEWENLKGDGSFAASARHVLHAMLDDPPASIDRLCAAAGLSRRSAQRYLAREGTSYRQILDETRRERVLKAVLAPGAPFAAISASAGYSSAAAINHAVRRWTGSSPSELLRNLVDSGG